MIITDFFSVAIFRMYFFQILTPQNFFSVQNLMKWSKNEIASENEQIFNDWELHKFFFFESSYSGEFRAANK